MTSLVLILLWLVAANLIALVPSRRNHWPQAMVLIALGVPILVYVTWENGAIIGLLATAAAMSVLRWPVFYLWCWLVGRPRR